MGGICIKNIWWGWGILKKQCGKKCGRKFFLFKTLAWLSHKTLNREERGIPTEHFNYWFYIGFWITFLALLSLLLQLLLLNTPGSYSKKLTFFLSFLWNVSFFWKPILFDPSSECYNPIFRYFKLCHIEISAKDCYDILRLS